MRNKKRLGIFFFYDKDGVVDRYVDYLFNGMSQVIDEFVVVVNGKLDVKGKELFSRYSKDIIVRKNEGMDAWAYKEAIEHIGWIRLRKYYEVVLFNYTIMGPVYPFSVMFEEMDKKQELDFWGINTWRPDCYHGNIENFCDNPFGYVPRHIQSHFIVYRKKFLQSKHLKKYWTNLPTINNYLESIGKHESYFTKYFEDMGFKWDVYVNDDEECENDSYLLFDEPVKAIEKYKCPIFKRKSFFYNPNIYLIDTLLDEPVDLFKCVQKLGYPREYILENITRTDNQKNVAFDIGLDKIVDVLDSKKDFKEACVIYYANSVKTIDNHSSLINNLYFIDKYYLTNKKLYALLENKKIDKKNNLKVILKKYKYICLINLNKLEENKISRKLINSVTKTIHESLLGNLEKIETFFKDDENLGLLCVNEQPNVDNFSNIGNVNHGDGCFSTQDYSVPYGSFWIRTNILTEDKNLNLKKILIDDFKKIPEIVKEKGYYCCNVSTLKNIVLRANAYEKMIGELNKSIKEDLKIEDYSFGSFVDLNQFKLKKEREKIVSQENEYGIKRYIRINDEPPLSLVETFKIKINSIFPFVFSDIDNNKKEIYKNYGIKFAIKVAICKFILDFGKTNNKDYQGNQHYKSIDFLKGIAILMIILVHYNQAYNPDFIFLRYFQMGCAIFFVASGFGIASLISNKYKNIEDNKVKIEFYISRLKAIYPLWIIAIIVNFIFTEIMINFSSYGNMFIINTNIYDIICNLLLINGIVPSAQNTVTPGGWFMGALVFLYLITPFVIQVFNKNKQRRGLVCAIMSLISIMILFVLNKINGLEFYQNNSFGYFLFFDHFPAYCLGMLLYFDISSEKKRSNLNSLLNLCLSIVALYESYRIYFHQASMNYNVSLWLMGIATYFILKVLITFEKQHGNISFNKTIENMGRNSYFIYLFHSFLVVNCVYIFREIMSIFKIDTNNKIWFFVLLPISIYIIYKVLILYRVKTNRK